MQLSPAHLIALLRTRGIRVEVEELLRLHEVLQAGVDWTPRRLENVVVGILATCPEDPAKIREAIRELRHAFEPTLTSDPSRPPRRIGRRLALGVGLGSVAAAAAIVAWRTSRRDEEPGSTSATDEDGAADDDAKPAEPAADDDAKPATNDTKPAADDDTATPERDGTTADTTTATPPDDPPAPQPAPAPWTTKEREDQLRYRAAQATRRAEESAARVQAIADIDRTRTSRRISVPHLVPKPRSWARLSGAGLFGPAAVAGTLAWFAHRTWRRRLRRPQPFAGPALEVAPGPSLFWLAARDRRWPPLLGAEAREALVWGVDHAAAEEPTRVLDEDATIAATIERGGLPELRFRGRRSLRRVWLWHDQSAAGPIGAHLCAEVQRTLHGYGLAVEVGHYWGLPERVERDDGRLLSLDALEEEREVSTVVVLTDGDELLRQWDRKDPQGRSRRPYVRTLLARLGGWANLTVVHTGPRERQRALRALLDPLGIPCVPLEALPLAVRERDHLLRTLGTVAPTENAWIWAALCALYPLPVPETLALALLRHLGLPISPLSIAQLLEQSATTAGIQFKPAVRARLLERLRRTLDDGSGGLPRAMRQALAFWREHTIHGDPMWASDTTGRGLHRRLVVALLDVWTDPERAAQELSALANSPHMPAIREELGRMRLTGDPAGAPEPGTFHVPLDPPRLSSTARARLTAAGMQGLPAPALVKPSPAPWPLPLRGLIAAAILLFVASVALLAVDALRTRSPDTLDLSRWALALRTDAAAGDQLQAHVAGEWYDVGAWPIGDVALAIETLEVPCPAADGALRRCRGDGASLSDPPGRIAILDAPPDADAAVRFADSLLDSNQIDAAWIGKWPPWLVDRTVRAIEDRRGLEVWVFTNDPEFLATGANVAKITPYPAIVVDATARVLAADFCPTTAGAVCAVTTTENDGSFLRATVAGTETTELRGHEGPLTAAALSLDGRRIVTASDDGTARVWNTDGSGEPVVLRGHGGAILSAAWSPDGRRIVTASADRTARIWTTDGTQTGSFTGHKDKVLHAAWSPDGARIVTTSADRTAQVWNADGSGAPVAFTGSTVPVTFARWSPDSRRIFIASADKTAMVRSVDNPDDIVVLAELRGTVTAAAWSSDGQYIVTGSADDTTKMWDPASGTMSAVLLYSDGSALRDIAFVGDGHVLTASESGAVRVWTADGRPASGRADISDESLAPLRAWDADPSALTQIHRSTDWPHLLDLFSAFKPGSPAIKDRHDVDLTAVFLDNPGALLVTGVPAPVTAATGVHDGTLLLGTQTGEIYRWSTSGTFLVASHKRPIARLTSSRDTDLSVDDAGFGQLGNSTDQSSPSIESIQLAVASLDRTGITVVKRSGELLMIDPSLGNRTVEVFDGANFKGNRLPLKIGKYDQVGVASASLSSLRLSPGLEVVLHDAADFKGEARTYTADTASVGDFDDRTRSIEVRAVDGLDAQTPEHVAQYGSVAAVASRSSDHVASISDGALHVCEKAPTWACRKLELGLEPQLVAASSSEGVHAVASEDRVPTIGVLRAIGEARDGRLALESRFKGPTGWPVALRYSADGKHLAVAALDGTVRLATTGDEEVGQDSTRPNAGGEACPRILRHETPLADIAFSPDNKLIATASFDADVRVFRAMDGAGPVRLTGHRGPVRSVSFLTSATETRLVSVSADGTARIWALPADTEFAGLEPAETLCDPEPDCPEGQVREGDRCVCPEGLVDIGDRCISVRCPAGMTFIAGTHGHAFMGAGKQRDVEDLCMDTTEVTLAAYTSCVSAQTCTEPDQGMRCNWGAGEDSERHPVNCVDWDQAKTYCTTKGKRLPTEWEWEWAARGRDEGRTYPWEEGKTPSCTRAIYGQGAVDGCGKDSTWPVGSKPLGDSRDGLKDMSGNVWEWMNGSYNSAGARALRGGGWKEVSAVTLRAANRDGSFPSNRNPDTGFRCVRTFTASGMR